MNVTTTERNGYSVIALQGEVDLQTSPQVRKALLHCLDEERDVLVDLAGVTYIDSSGVASLVEAFQLARKGGTRFALVGVSEAALRVLQLARLDRVFAIFPGLDEAMDAGR